jgi:hypothetical protein
VFNGKVIPVWTDQRKGFPNQEIYTANLSGIISVNNISSEIPSSYKLFQNYPNPFNPATKIRFDIPEYSFVKITVYDALGKEIAKPVYRVLNPGSYETEFNGNDLTTGIYFYKIEAGDFTETKKLVLIK